MKEKGLEIGTMNILSISNLKLKNFKGIKDFAIEPNGNTSIFGDNGTGKTTITDSVSYLFFGKDSRGKSDFQLKPVDKKGNEIHNLETEVEGIFDYNNKTVILKKRFKEKYTKKRGTAKQEFTGHTTDYFIDDVPAKKKEYDTKIAEIININSFKLVTNPMEFNSLHWTARRSILLEMCGDITDQDVIDSDTKLKKLSSILGDCSIDDHKKKIQAKKREINKELDQIPARIAENQEAAKDAEQPDPKEKTMLEKALEDEKEKLRSLTSNEALSAKKVRLNEINAEIQQFKNDANQKQADLKKPIMDAISKLESERWALVNQIKISKQEIERDEKRNKISSGAIDKVRERWYAEDEKQPSGDNSCPTCGQELPEEDIKSTIELFNKMKAERLEKINKEGVDLKKFIADGEKSIKAAKVSIDSDKKAVAEIDKDLEAKKADLKGLDSPKLTSPLDKVKESLEMEIEALLNGSKTQEGEVELQIHETQKKIEACATQEAAWNAAEKSRARIEELEGQEKTLAAKFEKLESELFLIEKFIVKKVGMLEGQINKKFKFARFKMFSTQVNGGIEECCETLFDGVPFNHGLNNAARINVGLDIIKTLSDFYGFRGPVFIDNAESVNEITPMDCQVINLVVSRDQELTVSERKEVKAAS